MLQPFTDSVAFMVTGSVTATASSLSASGHGSEGTAMASLMLSSTNVFDQQFHPLTNYTLTFSAVPEPATVSLTALGFWSIAMLGVFGRRKHS
jgi:hypothetical protein